MIDDPLPARLSALLAPDASQTLLDEDALQSAVATRLQSLGWDVRQRVECATGEADLVAYRGNRVVVVEVKRHLTRKHIYAATGQVLAYQQAIAPHAEAVIVGYATLQTQATARAVSSLVAVVALDPPPLTSSSPQVSPPQPLTSSPHTLHWNVSTVALARGIVNVSQLARRVGLGRQGLYGIWGDTARQVSLRTLSRLSSRLEVDPGGWFTWTEVGSGRTLRWDIARIASARGLSVARLARESGLHHKMVTRIWTAIALDTQLPTLAKLALVLGDAGRPLEVGELFVWRDAPATPPEGGHDGGLPAT